VTTKTVTTTYTKTSILVPKTVTVIPSSCEVPETYTTQVTTFEPYSFVTDHIVTTPNGQTTVTPYTKTYEIPEYLTETKTKEVKCTTPITYTVPMKPTTITVPYTTCTPVVVPKTTTKTYDGIPYTTTLTHTYTIPSIPS
jgi:hypothetical protein